MADVVKFSPDTIEQAAQILREGGLVILPLSTVYVISADATNTHAVKTVYRIKERPRINPLMVIVHSFDAAREFAVFDEVNETLASHFWPGPLTLSLPLKTGHPLSNYGLSKFLQGTIAVCVPDAPETNKVLERIGRPLICSSANPSGFITPTSPAHISEEISESVDLIFDNGPVPVGIETTIITTQFSKPVILRLGATPRKEIEKVLGQKIVRLMELPEGWKALADSKVGPCEVLPKYKLPVPLRLDAAAPKKGELLLGFGKVRSATLNLSERGDVREAARNLYSHLAELSARNPKAIAVSPIPERGIGEAINQRLRLSARASEQLI